MAFHLFQLDVFLGYLLLFGLNQFALCLLIRGIFAHETHAAIYLCQIFGRENEHHLLLHRTMARHVTHRADVFCLAVGQLLFKRSQLRVQYTNVSFNVLDIFLNAVNVLLAFANLAVDNHQLLQPLLYVGLIGFKGGLLLLYFFLYSLPLPLQALDNPVGFSLRVLAARGVSAFVRRVCTLLGCRLDCFLSRNICYLGVLFGRLCGFAFGLRSLLCGGGRVRLLSGTLFLRTEWEGHHEGKEDG